MTGLIVQNKAFCLTVQKRALHFQKIACGAAQARLRLALLAPLVGEQVHFYLTPPTRADASIAIDGWTCTFRSKITIPHPLHTQVAAALVCGRLPSAAAEGNDCSSAGAARASGDY